MPFKYLKDWELRFFCNGLWLKSARVIPWNYHSFTKILFTIHIFLYISFIVSMNGFNILEWSNFDKTLHIINLAFVAWCWNKYNWLYKNRGRASVGTILAENRSICVNRRFVIPHWEWFFNWFHIVTPVLFLAGIPGGLKWSDLLFLANGTFNAVVICQALVFLDIGRPKSTVWADIRNRQKNTERFTVPALVYS